MNEHESVGSGEPTQAGKGAAKAAKKGKGVPAPANGGGIDPHESVSGGEAATETADGAMTEGFEGVAASIETVEGFEPTLAAQESAAAEEVEISKEMEALPPAEDLTYEAPETVCGADNRVRISPATAIPWRWCCELLISYPSGAGARGTGWFIGPKTVMTADHVVYSAGADGPARSR